MKAALIGFLVGLVFGGLNQYTVWWAVIRDGSRMDVSTPTRVVGGYAIRLILDAAALFLAWRLTGERWALVGATLGILSIMGAFTWWQYGILRRGGG